MHRKAVELLRYFKNHKILSAFLALFLVLGLLGRGVKTEKKIGGIPSAIVLTTRVHKGTIEDVIRLNGTLEPKKQAKIKTITGGVIERIHVVEGQEIEEGELLAEIRQEYAYAWQSATVDGRVISANAVYDDAKTRYDRYTVLYERGVIASDKLEEAKRELGKARASLVEADLQKKTAKLSSGGGSTIYTKLKSPINGVVTGIRFHEGEIVISGANFAVASESSEATILEVADLSDMIVRLSVPESGIIGIKTGMGAQIKVLAAGETLPGKIYAVTPAGAVDQKTNVTRFGVLVDVFGEDQSDLLSGMTVEVVIPKRIKNNVLYLPPEYVYTDKNGEYALNADKKKVKIKTGMKTMDAVEVLEGLREGEVVSRVRVLDPDEFDVVRL